MKKFISKTILFCVCGIAAAMLGCNKPAETALLNQWQLVKIETLGDTINAPGEIPPLNKPYIIAFSGNNKASFPNACNMHGCNYSLSRNNGISFSVFFPMTEIYCGEFYEIEMKVLENLQKAETYKITGEQLVIYCGNGALYFKIAATKNNVQISEFNVSECMQREYDAAPRKTIGAKTVGNNLQINLLGMIFNCCKEDIAAVAGIDGNEININLTETFGGNEPCRCTCEYDIDLLLEGLAFGETYTIKIVQNNEAYYIFNVDFEQNTNLTVEVNDFCVFVQLLNFDGVITAANEFLATIGNNLSDYEKIDLLQSWLLEKYCVNDVEAVCISCIYADPAQSELNITFVVNNELVAKTMDVSMGETLHCSFHSELD